MVRHFVEGFTIITQAVYGDTGNSHQIKRTLIEDGSYLSVRHEMTIKSTGEMITSEIVYSKYK